MAAAPSPADDGLPPSIFFGAGSSSDESDVHDIPVAANTRPLPSATDDGKVAAFAADMAAGARMTPIEVLHVADGADDYYFSFGGCHRWAGPGEVRVEPPL